MVILQHLKNNFLVKKNLNLLLYLILEIYIGNISRMLF